MGWQNGTDATILDCSFTGNQGVSGGSIFAQRCSGAVTLGAAEITYNTATNAGGGIFQVRCPAALLRRFHMLELHWHTPRNLNGPRGLGQAVHACACWQHSVEAQAKDRLGAACSKCQHRQAPCLASPGIAHARP